MHRQVFAIQYLNDLDLAYALASHRLKNAASYNSLCIIAGGIADFE